MDNCAKSPGLSSFNAQGPARILARRAPASLETEDTCEYGTVMVDHRYELLDDDERPVAVVSEFLEHLGLRGCSPNTVSAYAHDLLHFFRFLTSLGLSWPEFRPPHALEFLRYLRSVVARRPTQRLGLAVVSKTGRGVGLAPESINRALTAVSSFYEYMILSGQLGDGEIPSRFA